MPGVTNRTTVTLQDKGNLTIAVKLANGQPATNAEVNVRGGTFPRDQFNGLRTDTNGLVELRNVFVGN